METIRQGYPELFQRCRETAACFIHTIDMRRTFDVNEEERRQFWEELYAGPGYGIWQGNFRDMLTDRAAKRLISHFVAQKLRGRVTDPGVAERLISNNHGFDTLRGPRAPVHTEVSPSTHPPQ